MQYKVISDFLILMDAQTFQIFSLVKSMPDILWQVPLPDQLFKNVTINALYCVSFQITSNIGIAKVFFIHITDLTCITVK